MSKSFETGMALFQVLLIVAIIAMLLLMMSATTNQQVERAQQLQDQTETQLGLHSASNYVDFLLLTNDWYDMRRDNTPIPQLNFHHAASRVTLPERAGYDALPEGINLRLQNEASLIGINQANEQLHDLLLKNGKTQTEADLMLGELRAHLYRADRIYLQHVNDLNSITGWSTDIIEAIQPYVTAKIISFNGAWAPDALLPVLLTSGQADTIIALRESGQYDPGIYESFSGQETGFGVTLYPSQEQRVTVTDPVTGEQLRRGVIYATHEQNPRTIEFKRYLREQRKTLNEANQVQY